MAALTEYSRSKLLRHILGIESFIAPTDVYLALYTVPPTDTYAGVEITGNGYSRQKISFSETTGTAFNTTELIFGSTGGAWGAITGISIMDAATSGNMLYQGTLNQYVYIAGGEVLKIPVGSIGVALS